jgi:DNA mismatch repair ATPase MutS
VQQRISNKIDLAGPAQVMLVTGSNMSGKSTYLRTVGVNAVLALVGAPVCAKSAELSSMEIVSSMRSADSLEENTSSFYAELKRLKQVIATVETGKPTLFLLDEILKGTNSRDQARRGEGIDQAARGGRRIRLGVHPRHRIAGFVGGIERQSREFQLPLRCEC